MSSFKLSHDSTTWWWQWSKFTPEGEGLIRYVTCSVNNCLFLFLVVSYECPIICILPILPTMSTLSINCFFLGGDLSEIFTVKILETKNISILKGLIKEELSPCFNHVIASEFITWKLKVSLPVDTITSELTVNDVEAQKLHPLKKISSIFSKALMDEHVHILVQVPTGALHKCFLDLS